MIGFQRNTEKFSAIILAAGKSSRMGFPKLLLKFDEKRTFLEKLIEEYTSFGCYEIVVVVNEEGFKAVRENNIKLAEKTKILLNPHPEWERFFSLKLGVGELSQLCPTFIHNIDNPFVGKDVLSSLCESLKACAYACPVYNGKGGHPILLAKEIVDLVKAKQEDNIHFKEFLANFDRIGVDVENEDVLSNINTKENYNDWVKLNNNRIKFL